MVFRYFDEHMGEIAMEELSKMEIWNPTMEHIFAQTMKRIEEGNITVAPQIVRGFEV